MATEHHAPKVRDPAFHSYLPTRHLRGNNTEDSPASPPTKPNLSPGMAICSDSGTLLGPYQPLHPFVQE